MQNIEELLDKVFQGDEQAYKDYLLDRLSPKVIGQWQIVDSLKYLCKKAKNEPEVFNNCYPELLIELAWYLSNLPDLTSPDVNQFRSLLSNAANAGVDGAQIGLWSLKFSKRELTLADLNKSKERVMGLLSKENKSKHDYFFISTFY